MTIQIWQTVSGSWIAQAEGNDLQVIAGDRQDAVNLLVAALEERQIFISLKD